MIPIANETEHGLLVTSYIKHKEFDLSFKSGWVLCSKIKRPIRFSYWMGKENKMDKIDELVELLKNTYHIKWSEKKQQFFENGKKISRR